MKIFVTGGTGFIGSHFVRQALGEGHSILALRRSSASTLRIPLKQEPQWLDRSMDEVTVEDLEGFHVLVHFAAHTGNVPYDTLFNCLRWNLMSTLALFEQARLAGIQRFVVAGSCFEYGKSGEHYEAIPTNAPLLPTNSYAASKAAASIALIQWAEEHQLSLDILRVFHVFGEGEAESRLWPTLRRAAMAGVDVPMTAGEQTRDFLLVDNVASAFLAKAVQRDDPKVGVRIFNISSGESCTLRAFAEYWWQEWKAQGSLIFGAIPYRKGEVMHYTPGPTLLVIGETLDKRDLSDRREP
jgi:nucleoside-diphosphate-sugar epimerase